MSGIHDMGGSTGHGPVVVEEDEPVFHHDWEGRVNALGRVLVARGLFNFDEFRRTIERMEPTDYLRASYYERWLYAVETLTSEKGVVGWDRTRAEDTHSRSPEQRVASTERQPRFSAGSRVATKNLNPKGHTRLPQYARGKRGTVDLVHRPFLLPDTNSQGNGTDWEHVYSVRFGARELWGNAATAADSVCIDLWESYLEDGRHD